MKLVLEKPIMLIDPILHIDVPLFPGEYTLDEIDNPAVDYRKGKPANWYVLAGTQIGMAIRGWDDEIEKGGVYICTE